MRRFLCIIAILLSISVFAFESEYLNFYGYKKDITDELVAFAEYHFERISEELNITLDKKINIEIFSDFEAFHEAINFPDASDYCISHNDGKTTIYMVSPSNSGSFHDSDSVKRSLIGNIAQLLLKNKVTTKVPSWLISSFGYYETSYIPEGKNILDKISKQLITLIGDKKNFALESIWNSSSYRDFEEDYKENKHLALEKILNSTALNFSFVKFIIENFGYEKLIEYVKDLAIKETFEISIDSFIDLWFEFTLNNFSENY